MINLYAQCFFRYFYYCCYSPINGYKLFLDLRTFQTLYEFTTNTNLCYKYNFLSHIKSKFSVSSISTQLEKSYQRCFWWICSSLGCIHFWEVDSMTIFQVNTEMHENRKVFMNVETKNSLYSFITANIMSHFKFLYFIDEIIRFRYSENCYFSAI